MKSKNISQIYSNEINVFDEEFSCNGLVGKVISKDKDVINIFLITSEKQLICVEVVDRGFIQQEDFPIAGKIAYFDNLIFTGCIHVNHNDLSISSFDVPTLVLE